MSLFFFGSFFIAYLTLSNMCSLYHKFATQGSLFTCAEFVNDKIIKRNARQMRSIWILESLYHMNSPICHPSNHADIGHSHYALCPNTIITTPNTTSTSPVARFRVFGCALLANNAAIRAQINVKTTHNPITKSPVSHQWQNVRLLR